MTFPSEDELNALREEGFRPTVVVCCTHKKKALLVYSRKQRSWTFVQGGIELGEDLRTASQREVLEECGTTDFLDPEADIVFLGQAQVPFRSQKSKKRTYQLPNGEWRKMLGKAYFFLHVPARYDFFPLENSEFDSVRWANVNSLQRFAEKLEPPERKDAYIAVIQELVNGEFVA